MDQGGKHVDHNPWVDNPPIIEPVKDTDIDSIPSFNTPIQPLKRHPHLPLMQENYFQSSTNIEQQGVYICKEKIGKIECGDDVWQVATSNTKQCFDQIVLAFGRQTKSWFPHLDITLQSGSLMKVHRFKKLQWNHSV